MPIAIEEKSEISRLVEEEFASESELQGYLERCPYLLASGAEPEVRTVQREVSLPAAGSLDLLLVDREGTPIAVEVKLAKNSQSRREVVAQAFDYVSDLNQLTVDELDDRVDGALVGCLEELQEDTSAEDLRRRCGTNLRAGQIRLVIAIDQAGDDLVRIIQYINDHSDLDVRLVAISKFKEGTILVPRILVSGGGETKTGSATSSTMWTAEKLREAFLGTGAGDKRGRMERFLDWATAGHCFMESRASSPAFGIRSRAGRRILTVYSSGTLYLFYREDRYRGGAQERNALVEALAGLDMVDQSLPPEKVIDGRNCTRTLWELQDGEFEKLLEALHRACHLVFED